MAFTQSRIFQILDKGDSTDKTSLACDYFLSILIFLNLLAVCLESISSLGETYQRQFFLFEMFSVIVFAVEYLLRIWSMAADEKNRYPDASRRRASYIFSFHGIVDLAAILPSILPYFFPGTDLRWLRVLRLLRLLKISHYSTALEDLFSAIYQERQSFVAALYLMAIALFLSSSMMYLAEYEAQPENFQSIPHTMWWSMITLTTVGYGDVSPVTGIGKIVGAFTALMGVCAVALLTGIVASAFSNQMARREAIFEAEVNAAMADGVITEDEADHIEDLRGRFKITEQHAKAIFDNIAEQQEFDEIIEEKTNKKREE
jgi:voltage-gated potassium channel|tara:strand:+ start:36356 stop:37306 length:951 start_codon:yes stop_codon:yes gene_type:complete